MTSNNKITIYNENNQPIRKVGLGPLYKSLPAPRMKPMKFATKKRYVVPRYVAPSVTYVNYQPRPNFRPIRVRTGLGAADRNVYMRFVLNLFNNTRVNKPDEKSIEPSMDSMDDIVQ